MQDNTLLFLGGLPYSNRTAKCSPNHLLGTASPAFVKSWVFDQDGEVVADTVVATVRTGGTARDVVPANLAPRLHVLQDAKL